MKKTFASLLAIVGLTAFAVEPVAVWNGDFLTKTIGSYTLSENGNTVAEDGSSITISQNVGITIARSSALAKNVGMTVIYKFENLVVGSTVKTIGTASAGGGNADRVGVNVQTSGQTSGIWANTGTYNTNATKTTIPSIEQGLFAFVYGPNVSSSNGTYLYLKNGSADYALAYSCSGLKSSDDTVQAMTVGGTRQNGTTFPAASGMIIKAIAMFDQAMTKDEIAAYEFPEIEVPTAEYNLEFNGSIDSTGTKSITWGNSEKGLTFAKGRTGEDNTAYRTVDGSSHPWGSFSAALPSSYTVTCWMKSVPDAAAPLWSLGNSTTDHKVLGLMTGSKTDTVTIVECSSAKAMTKLATDISVPGATTGFHHYVLVYRSKKVMLFYDGKYTASATTSIEPTNKLQIGGVHGGTLDGQTRTSGILVDDWRLFEQALSSAQIAMMAGIKIPPAIEGTLTPQVTVAKDYESATVTLNVEGVSENDYTVSYSAAVSGVDGAIVGEVAEKIVTFTFDTLTPGKVHRGTITLTYGDTAEELATIPLAIYAGERQYTEMASAMVIKAAETINAAEGCTVTISDVMDDPDYVENCDSTYTVSISAAEAVDASADGALKGDEQGGVRIANTANGLKLQVLKNGEWTSIKDASIDTEYVVTVDFHYNKGKDDAKATGVTYTVEGADAISSGNTVGNKISEVFIADGTVLSADLTGLFEFDSVVVDVELEPGDEQVGIEAADDDEAQKIADKLKVGLSEAVAAVLTTTAAQDAYRAYFKIVAVKAADGTYTAQVVFTSEAQNEIEEEVEASIASVVDAFNNGGTAEITAKPGLYYGVKRGDTLGGLKLKEELTLADGNKVKITITKPSQSKKHFYRIIVSPVPMEKDEDEPGLTV